MYTIQLKDKTYQVELDNYQAGKGTINGKPFNLDIQRNGDHFHVVYNHQSYQLELTQLDPLTKEITLKLNHDKMQFKVADDLDVLLHRLGMDKMAQKKVNDVRAPMPGLVLDVLVDKGQVVKKGDTLVILEAMKMENNIKSPVDGKIVQIACVPKKAVEKNDLLVVFE